MEFEDRISKASAPGRGRSRGFRDHQHFNWLARFKWQPLQNEFAMLPDRSLSPVCLHAPSIEDLAARCAARASPTSLHDLKSSSAWNPRMFRLVLESDLRLTGSDWHELLAASQLDALLHSLGRLSDKYTVLGAHANGESTTTRTRIIGPGDR